MGKISTDVEILEKSWNGDGKKLCEDFISAASQIILNKKAEIRLALICFLARGHLLIEDIPGVGKTTFVKTLRYLLGLGFSRIQFTSDLLPGDILGTSIYDPQAKAFKLNQGPIFSDFVLADELNRATPRTQSALLQAMEERQISIDRETHDLPACFFLVATQNPRFHLGTYPLPESQLDRFLMRIELGYPGPEAEATLLLNSGSRMQPETLQPIFDRVQIDVIQKRVKNVHISLEIANYIQRILAASRESQLSSGARSKIIGLSTRGGLALAEAAKAAAFLSGREFVLPEDVQSVVLSVINHRITEGEHSFQQSAVCVKELVDSVAIS